MNKKISIGIDSTRLRKGFSAFFVRCERKKRYFKTSAERDAEYQRANALQALGLDAVALATTRETLDLDQMRRLAAGRGIDLMEIFKAGMAHTPNQAMPIKTARDTFVLEKRRAMEAGEIKKVTFDQQRTFANRLVDGGSFASFSDLVNPRFESWLRGHGLSPKGLHSFCLGLGVFLNWCVRKQFLAQSPLKDVAIPDPKPKRPVFTVAQVTELFAIAQRDFPELVPLLAVEWFAGVRPHTAVLLDYSDFDRTEKVIQLREGKFTAGETEFVERIPECLWHWLPETKAGPLAPTRVRLKLRKFRAAVGYGDDIRWPVDVARHTFASHFAAFSGSLDQVAFAMNHHGPSTTLKYYRKRVTQAEGVAFFALRPLKK